MGGHGLSTYGPSGLCACKVNASVLRMHISVRPFHARDLRDRNRLGRGHCESIPTRECTDRTEGVWTAHAHVSLSVQSALLPGKGESMPRTRTVTTSDVYSTPSSHSLQALAQSYLDGHERRASPFLR